MFFYGKDLHWQKAQLKVYSYEHFKFDCTAIDSNVLHMLFKILQIGTKLFNLPFLHNLSEGKRTMLTFYPPSLRQPLCIIGPSKICNLTFVLFSNIFYKHFWIRKFILYYWSLKNINEFLIQSKLSLLYCVVKLLNKKKSTLIFFLFLLKLDLFISFTL